MKSWTRKDRARYYKGIKSHLLRQSNLCALCGKAIERIYDATIDHIVPLSRGGSEHISNLQLAHESCNHRKGNSLP